MTMLDSFFSKGFKAAKCKTLLKLTIPRIKLLRNRREIQIKQMRREIAKLLETGQEATARIRVEHIIREEKMMTAQEIVELFCELITVRLPIVEAQRECPLDLKEAISSVCFAAPRCTDLPELLQVQMMFAGKYGKEFVASATELMPECGVSRQLVELLSVRAPAPDVKLKLLKEIAQEHELDWDPSTSESELSKTHDDLLNGPTQFVTGSKVPLPQVQHDEAKKTTSEPAAREHSDSDDDFTIVDYPEVPRQELQSNKATASAPEMLPFPASAHSDVDDQNEQNPFGVDENLPSEGLLGQNSVVNEDASLKISTGLAEDKQFVPFIRPPPESFPVRDHNLAPSISKIENDGADLQDVLAAAQAAADTAERAAAAACSAASLAQFRITELMKKNDDVLSSSSENPFHLEKPKSESNVRNAFGESDSTYMFPSHSNISGDYVAHTSYDNANGVFDSSPNDNAFSHGSLHQPQRLPSMEDDTYFSYPNLFTSQETNISSHVHKQ